MDLKDLAAQRAAEQFRAEELARQEAQRAAHQAEQARLAREAHARELRAQLKGK